MRQREWTPEEVEWLKENYPIKSDRFCRIQLHVCWIRLREKVKELGLQKAGEIKVRATTEKPAVKNPVWHDEGCERYCMECLRYHPGGGCQKTGKEVGALWQKKCFKGRV